jgi:serine/threonine-protein phosphatase 2A regulatory subunit A
MNQPKSSTFASIRIHNYIHTHIHIERRVRNNLSKVFSTVALNLNIEGKEAPQTTIMSCFVALLQDQEGEVRASAVAHLAKMVHWGGAALFALKLQALLPALADDVVVDVRSKCALALMDASEGGTLEDTTIVKAFTPLLENFLQDEYPEVQLRVLGNLSRISHLLTQMSGVVNSILNMSKATNWRVRRGVATLLPHLADARGMDFFSTVLLEPAWIALLTDNVSEVRAACIAGMYAIQPGNFHSIL